MNEEKTNGVERFRFNGNNDDFWESVRLSAPKVLWTVQIPKGGQFHINYTCNLSLWARMWMRFIGWGVTKVEQLKGQESA